MFLGHIKKHTVTQAATLMHYRTLMVPYNKKKNLDCT